MSAPSARDHLAWAADLPLNDALALYPELAPHVGVVKVGLSLFVEHGPRAVEAFQALGARVFLDLKLHDIPNTVDLAAQRAAALGVAYLTVHASGGTAMLRAALAGADAGASKRGLRPPLLLGVTVLTSLGDADLHELGLTGPASLQAARLAGVAVAAGLGGLVCSAHEASALKVAHPGVELCTPGIRPAGSAKGDQTRVETPAAAIQAGASLLVLGRPLHGAASPGAAAAALAKEVQDALLSRAS